MDDWLKIKCNYKHLYSYGMYHAGFDLFDSLYLENLTDQKLSGLTVQVLATPNALCQGECVVDFLAPSGCAFLSGDFIQLRDLALAAQKSILDISISIRVLNAENDLIAQTEIPCKILPYYYFSGVGDMLETVSFFVTPTQKELEEILPSPEVTQPLEICRVLYEKIKERKITYSSEDYSGTMPLPVRLPEKVLHDRFANSLELSLLFVSACERLGLSPVLAFAGRGKVYCGISRDAENSGLITHFSKSQKDFDSWYLLDGSYFAYGSELDFDSALFYSRNSLFLTDEKVLLLNLSVARSMGLVHLPDRYLDDEGYALDRTWEQKKSGSFSEYHALVRQFSHEPLVQSILAGEKISVATQKTVVAFEPELDVNQNKIFQKILSNDFTLLRAQPGTGVSTLFSHAAAAAMKSGKSVLYITDPHYHADDFSKVLEKQFHPIFVWNLFRDGNKRYVKSDFKAAFSPDPSAFDDKKEMQSQLDSMDAYYLNLEGEKRIVSSFLMATDRFHQLRDANDSIHFSPEQIGMLSDEMVGTWFSTANEILQSYTEIGTVIENPLRLVAQKNFSYEYKSKLTRQLEEVLHSIEALSLVRDQILPSFSSLDGLLAGDIFFAFLDLTRLFSEFVTVPETFFENPEVVEDHFRKVAQLIQAKKENDAITDSIQISFDPHVFDLDASDLYARYQALEDKGLIAMSQRHGILKSVKRYLKPNCDVENAEYILSRLDLFQKNVALIQAESEFVFRLLSVPFADDDASWDALQVAADLCYQCYSIFRPKFSTSLLPSFVSEFCRAKNNGLTEKLAQLRDLGERYQAGKKELEITLSNSIDLFYPQALGREQDYFSVIYHVLSAVLSETERLKGWCGWLTAREKALRVGMKNLVLAVEGGKILPEELSRGFLRAFFQAVCEYNFLSHPELIPGNFDFSEHQRGFENAFRGYSSKRREEMNSILSLRAFDALFEIQEETFDPESLFREKPEAFSRLFPCVIADLSQAKSLFENCRNVFDYVLIESRNSIPLADLLFAFSAGKHVAFAGGFSANRRREGEVFDLSSSGFDYLWKVTDEKYSLSSVYRAAPNYTVIRSGYAAGLRGDSRCYTIPAPAFYSCAHWIQVPGTFGGEYPGANFFEAEKAVELLLDFAAKEEKKSLGVVTATPEQKELILQLLTKRLRDDETLQGFFATPHRFIVTHANENLPCCDCILFSTVFAPDRSIHGSRLPYSFLEFGGKDPKRTVLHILSSARESITVLSSFKSEELKCTPTTLPVVSAFALLFDVICAHRVNNSFAVVDAMEGTSYINRLAEELENRGYRVILGLQSGRYYIDLAVVSPRMEFLLGILSDQTVLNQKANVSAIEMANTRRMTSCGWQIYRLRSANCFVSFDREVEKILEILGPFEEGSQLE